MSLQTVVHRSPGGTKRKHIMVYLHFWISKNFRIYKVYHSNKNLKENHNTRGMKRYLLILSFTNMVTTRFINTTLIFDTVMEPDHKYQHSHDIWTTFMGSCNSARSWASSSCRRVKSAPAMSRPSPRVVQLQRLETCPPAMTSDVPDVRVPKMATTHQIFQHVSQMFVWLSN